MQEQHVIYVVILGLVLVVIGFFWLLRRAFQQRVWWGLGVLFFPPTAIFFIGRHFRKALAPLLVFLLGAGLAGGTWGANYYYAHHASLGPREKMVDGERHIALTDWDGDDYEILTAKPDTVVLQMANPNVTDQTLDYLQAMTGLRELDLNYTQVTDEGLRTLSQLPRLRILRLRKTRVTDQGFRDYFGDKDSLLEVDLRETTVASKTLRDWKNKKKDTRKYLK